MKRVLGALTVLAAIAVGVAAVYQVEARERTYRRLLSQGDAALASSQTFAALDHYGGAIALRPDSMLAHLKRGETYRQRGDLEAATLDFRTAAGLDPSATRPLDSWADVLYQQQRFRRASEVYAERLRLDDRSAPVRYRLALSLYRDGNLTEALAATERAVALDDKMVEAHYLAGLCLKDQQRLVEAAFQFEAAITLEPGSIPAREELADIYRALGRFGPEIEQLQVLVGLDPVHVERRLAVGLAHARAGHSDLAVLTLASTLEQTADQAVVYGALGRVWLEIAQTRRDRTDAIGKALEALERAASSPVATSEVKTLYGRALAHDRQYVAAEHVLQQATERSPADPAAFAEYAAVAEQQQHYSAARTALVSYTALVGSTGDAAVHATKIGQLSIKLNDAETAVSWLRRAALSAPDNVETLASLAEAELLAGHAEQAREALQHALTLDPASSRLRALSRRIS